MGWTWRLWSGNGTNTQRSPSPPLVALVNTCLYLGPALWVSPGHLPGWPACIPVLLVSGSLSSATATGLRAWHQTVTPTLPCGSFYSHSCWHYSALPDMRAHVTKGIASPESPQISGPAATKERRCHGGVGNESIRWSRAKPFAETLSPCPISSQTQLAIYVAGRKQNNPSHLILKWEVWLKLFFAILLLWITGARSALLWPVLSLQRAKATPSHPLQSPALLCAVKGREESRWPTVPALCSEWRGRT